MAEFRAGGANLYKEYNADVDKWTINYQQMYDDLLSSA
jgi:hypothetical protein